VKRELTNHPQEGKGNQSVGCHHYWCSLRWSLSWKMKRKLSITEW